MFYKLPEENIQMIINYIYSFKDFKNIRLINKLLYKNSMIVWSNNKNNILDIHPRSTMIYTRRCMSCKKSINNHLQMFVDYYDYPQPVYIICNNWRCVSNCFIHMFSNAWENKLVFLNFNKIIPEKCIIPRSNNKLTIANVKNYHILLKDNIYFNTDWREGNNIYSKFVNLFDLKDKKNNKLNSEKFKKLKILSWYKNHKDDFHELDMNDIKLKGI